MEAGRTVVRFALDRPKLVTGLMVAATVILAALIPMVKVDTDPENMLSETEAVRVFHNEMKREFTLHDMVVLGIVNEKDPDGVFNPNSLAKIYELTKFAEGLRWPDPHDPNKEVGVIEVDLLAPSKVDNIEPVPGQPGTVRFEWLMAEPPKTREGAQAIRAKAKGNPLLDGTLVSEDGKALCLYLPLTSKHLSYRVYSSLKNRMPMLWTWGPIAQAVRKLDVSPETRPAIEAFLELGRLAAFQAGDRAELLSYLRGPTTDYRSLSDTLGNWDAEAAQSLRDAAGMVERWAREAPRDEPGAGGSSVSRWFRERITKDAKEDWSGRLWLELAALHVDSLAGTTRSASEVVGSAAAQLRRVQAALEQANAAELKPLPDAVAKASADQEFPGAHHYHITGLPVAEDTFGVEMFVQMAISAPLAMLVIFILMFVFFRKLVLIVSPLIVAMVSVVCTMGLLIGTGHTVHIMSSMIPIFIMPIAVLDSIHILSEFFEYYQQTKDRRKTIERVMEELFSPMLYTSLTSAAGFASLALTPIPPVQVFGAFVALGVMLAWVLTVMFIPAYTMLIPERWLANFGAVRHEDEAVTRLGKMLRWLGGFAYHRAKLILVATLIVAAIAGYGISRIQINDNPVKWFTKGHPIRVADHVLNEHFGGTYMAYLVLEPEQTERKTDDVAKALDARFGKLVGTLKDDFPEAVPTVEQARALAADMAKQAASGDALLDALSKEVATRKDAAEGDAADAWAEVAGAVGSEQLAVQVFKRPDVLRYIHDFQQALLETQVVGKSNSVADIVRKVYKELMEGKDEYYRVPDSQAAVAQCLLSFQNSHDPDDLWHLVTPDYRKANLWVQLRSGDNRDMEKVVAFVDRYLAEHAPPVPLKHRWFGLTYINVVWQDKMVSGMLQSFLGSFLIVFVMMVVLFRSPLWGLLSMIPLTVTIALIYGLIGLIGKDYDMPVAVLSALSLGLAVDFAIHFLARSRSAAAQHGSWEKAAVPMFGEPARAITRNIIVIAVGFLPLLAAPLMPYKTVGFFMAAILAVSGVATLFVLAALMRVLAPVLFKAKAPLGATCNCGVCIASSIGVVLVVALGIHQYATLGWTTLTWMSVAAIPALTLVCGLMSRRAACRAAEAAGPAEATADERKEGEE